METVRMVSFARTIFCLWLVVAASVFAQVKPSAGTILVASNSLNDSDFARSVVLLVHADEQGSVGLILNHISDVPLARIFPDLKRPAARASLFYQGGPVMTGVLALLRVESAREYSAKVFGDLYVLSEIKALKKMLDEQEIPASRLRIYAGYAGWSAGQLRAELERGDWRTVPPSANLVFDPHPETLWSRLGGGAKSQR